MDYTYGQIAKMIDHSLLNPTLAVPELEAGCRLALQYDVASVCIMPYYLRRCADLLGGSSVRASTTIGFPHGGHTTAVKVAEAERALADGGQELDMVVNGYGGEHRPGPQRKLGLRARRYPGRN
jgi:deoxyribose-phosphate aldolase